MTIFLQALFSGLALGAVYALIALGYSVIFSTLKMGHFAQGEFYMLGALCGLILSTNFASMPVALVFLFSGLAVSAAMLILERIAYRPLYNRPSNYLLIATIAMQYIVQYLVRLLWGSEYAKSPELFENKIFTFGPVVVTMQNLAVMGISAALMIVLTIFMKKTKTGIAMSAVSMNRRAASMMGVKISTIIAATYIISAFLAAVAGCLMGPVYSVVYHMGATMGNKAMVAAVMGGFGTLPGAMLGGLLLGVAETLCGVYISATYKEIVSFFILIAVLMIRPQGILGKKSIMKV